MKIRNAIQLLKYFPDWNVDDGWLTDNEMSALCDVAISALEKQIPKKPVIYKGTNRADCPICGMTVRGIAKPFGDFCSKCGQRLDWGE